MSLRQLGMNLFRVNRETHDIVTVFCGLGKYNFPRPFLGICVNDWGLAAVVPEKDIAKSVEYIKYIAGVKLSVKLAIFPYDE